jgi:superoxide dismutase, Fe-Mn family
MADYTLPDLPYDYAALEPHISGAIMELHHSKHHATYVKGANTALEQLAEARERDALTTVNMLEKNLAFNLGGHVNHSVFWPNMSPDGGAETEADPAVFRQAMDRAIGDAAGSPDPLRGLAQMMFGLSSLSGILLDELADATGRSRGEVLHAVNLRYLDPTG